MIGFHRRQVLGLSLASTALVTASGLRADDFPSGLIRLLVPFAPGGTLDLIARLVAARLPDVWSTSTIVENRPGAGGIVASLELLRARPDGRTLLLVAGGHAINPLVYARLPYDTARDFSPVTKLAEAGNVLLVNADRPTKTVADLIALLKSDPSARSYGTAGNGTSVHLAGALFSQTLDVPLAAIHFKGDSQSLVSLMGGHIPFSFNSLPAALAQAKTGAVRALAVTSGKRAPSLPDVPTMAETLPGYDVTNWWGIVASGKTDPALVNIINAGIKTALGGAQAANQLADLGVTVSVGSPDDFRTLIEAETAKWAPVIKAAGIETQE